jgi:hypothetical protein
MSGSRDPQKLAVWLRKGAYGAQLEAMLGQLLSYIAGGQQFQRSFPACPILSPLRPLAAQRLRAVAKWPSRRMVIVSTQRGAIFLIRASPVHPFLKSIASLGVRNEEVHRVGHGFGAWPAQLHVFPLIVGPLLLPYGVLVLAGEIGPAGKYRHDQLVGFVVGQPAFSAMHAPARL